MRYTIQVGAFSNITNAVRLAEKLQNHGLSAYHFLGDSDLYRVRFGNYSSKTVARTRAEKLQAAGVIDGFYIVSPDAYAAIKDRQYGNSALREDLVKTAKRYVGVDYQWGGESSRRGFDCSGLTMVVYQLNGLELPRSSREQWVAGTPVRRSQLLKGDLVFFATAGGKSVSHVGIYLGENQFLHAPGKGSKIRITSLSSTYFSSRYLGARTYL
jgi:cell wall-associated NlpC family hydrolase